MPMTPGLMSNIRLPGPEEEAIPGDDVMIEIIEDGEDKEKKDDNGAVLEIEHPDGSITISLDGKPIKSNSKELDRTDWYRNLVDDIAQGQLSSISEELLRGIRDDIQSRNDWIEDRAQGIKLLGLRIEIPGLQGPGDGAPVSYTHLTLPTIYSV